MYDDEYMRRNALDEDSLVEKFYCRKRLYLVWT